MAAASQPDPEGCFHCGLPVPAESRVWGRVGGVRHPMCCIGCSAAAEMLDAVGLADWYDYREGPSGRPAELPGDVLARSAFLGHEDVEADFIDRENEGRAGASLLVDDLRCAACVWVIERHLGQMEGVDSVQVSLTTHRVRVEWDPARRHLGDLIERLAEIGFAARVDRPGEEEERQTRESRAALIRLGLAGLGAMNVMTYSVALYVGAFEGIGEGAVALMRWLGWLVSTPIVFISARPFFVGAWRDLRNGRPGMDVPVAIAIGGAYGVSALATYSGKGEVYFDSVCMFTFFLSLARYLELRVRSRSTSFVRSLTLGAPVLGRRIEPSGEGFGQTERVVPARALQEGDRVRVRVGEVIPADGVILEGASAVDEALLTGEPWPRTVAVGDAVVAGSQNVDDVLTIEAKRVGKSTTLAAIVQLVERAAAGRAPIALLADRVAIYFVSAVLGVALVNLLVWQQLDPSRAIWTTLSVLVATCPCALSLATPAAISAATQGLAQRGFLITNSGLLEGLSKVDRFIFDKTGTLTQGTPTLAKVFTRSGVVEDDAVSLARRLEQHSTHPIARAFRATKDPRDSALTDGQALEATDLRTRPGQGVEGRVAGRFLRLGRPDWVAAESPATSAPVAGAFAVAGSDEDCVWVSLADAAGPMAHFGLNDPLRAEVPATLKALRAQGLEVELLSGDPSPVAARLGARLEMEVHLTGASSAEKLKRVRSLQDQGEAVAVVGDGVNDSPALRAGDVSIAMGTGSDLTRLNADAVLLRDDLALLPVARDWAHRTRQVISQNLIWATAYNLLALPLAVSGVLTPWMAALGMSASSLVVTLNALRLRKGPTAR